MQCLKSTHYYETRVSANDPNYKYWTYLPYVTEMWVIREKQDQCTLYTLLQNIAKHDYNITAFLTIQIKCMF